MTVKAKREPSVLLNPADLVTDFDPDAGLAKPDSTSVRRLRDLGGMFRDQAAFEATCRDENPLVYTVQVFSPRDHEGDLSLGFGRLEPGTVGDEFYMTKGHVHERTEMAEIYVGLRGRGVMLLRNASGGHTRALDLSAGKIVYVPGHTLHRTVNCGDEALCYFGIYPSLAGHDYSSLQRIGFDAVVIRSPEGPKVLGKGEELAVTR